MMYDLGQYISGGSMIHKLEPRVKIIAVIALSMFILHISKPGIMLLGVSVILLSIIGLARLPMTQVLFSLKPAMPFFLVLFLLYLFFTPGRPLPLFPLGPVLISYEGLTIGIVQIWKFLLLITAASVLTITTNHAALTGGLERLLRPINILRISSHDIAMLLGLALRFVPTLQQEMRNVRDAQLARGAKLELHRPAGQIKAVSVLAMPLLLSILRRSDELVDAMEARGYQPGSRSYLYETELTRGEYIVITTLVILTAAIMIYPVV